MTEDDPSDETFGKMVMPFIAIASSGGPYNDQAFIAGFMTGQINAQLALAQMITANEVRYTVLKTLLKQLDLIAMRYGYTMDVAASSAGDDWAYVRFLISADNLEGDPDAGSD